MRLGFSKLLEKCVKKKKKNPPNKGTLKERLAEDFIRSVLNAAYVMLFSNFLYESICCGYSFELPQKVEAIQMNTHNICYVEAIQFSSHNICFYKAVDKCTLRVPNCLTVR